MKAKYAEYFVLEKQVQKVTQDSLDRSEIISQFTEGKKTSLTDLSPMEYRELLKWIKTTFKVESLSDWQNSPENRMRRKIIGYFKSMHYTLPNGSADMKRINQWCLTYSIEKKLLNDHTKAELVQLVSQVQKVYQSFITSVSK